MNSTNKTNLKNSRVALLSPRAVAADQMIRRVQPPLGLVSIAAVLRSQGCENLLVLDSLIEDYDDIKNLYEDDDSMITYGASNDYIVEKLKSFLPTIIGISSLFSSQVSQAYSLASAVKKEFPNIPVIFGGVHASDKAEDVLNENKSIDFVLSGEADLTFADFVNNFPNKDFYDVEGLIWREGNDIKSNKRPDFIKDLDILPFPAWDLLPMEKYFEIAMYHNPFVKSGRVGCIMTSRGCPDKCYFCASTVFFGHGFRAMSPERVGELVQYMVDVFDIKELQIEDDNFAVNHRRVVQICEQIKKHKLRITMPNAMRADTPINRDKRFEMFKAMKDAGWESIGLGVEHGDQDFLNDVMKKRLKLDEVVATCDLAHKAGLLVHCNFMMGFPYETSKQRNATIEFARKLDADSYSLSLATPLPGTGMWDIIEEGDLFLDSYDLDKGLPTLVSIKPKGIAVDELQKLVEKVNKELNLNASTKREGSKEKYKLFKDKNSFGDRKYTFDPSSAQIPLDQ
jgi:anaerobic magnesium-protoporphyrin IX monomethyl ester cyclase